MNSDSKNSLSESHAYAINRSMNNDKPYKGKRIELKCHHCHNIGHSIGRCWILHPELKLDSDKKKSSQRSYDTKSHVATAHFTNTSSSNVENFSTNPFTLLNDFAAYLKEKGDTAMTASASDSVALLILSLLLLYWANSFQFKCFAGRIEGNTDTVCQVLCKSPRDIQTYCVR